jgi:hypothetical protein
MARVEYAASSQHRLLSTQMHIALFAFDFGVPVTTQLLS